MATDDAARRWTDGELKALERRMRREYSRAAKDMSGKQAEWLERFDREREQREKALDSTEEAMEAHKRWLQSQAARGEWLGGMADQLARSAHEANVRAADMVNDAVPRVYAENANRAAYEVDSAIGRDTAFTLLNEDAVRHVMGLRDRSATNSWLEDGQLLRETVWFMPQEGRERIQDVRRREVDAAKDIQWNRRKFASAITQGILQGESIPNIVKRTESIFGQNRNAAVRAARTAVTNAENAGKMGSYDRAEALGIPLVREWMATLDGRTRDSHRALDGEQVGKGEAFSNGLRYPGDPEGPGHEVWNCRCALRSRVKGFEESDGERWSRLPKGTTYEQWKAGRPVSRAESYKSGAGRVSGAWYAQQVAGATTAAVGGGFAGIMEGQDILGTWQRRPDQYDFEIEDVMAAQGFDGKPRIVDADEFDRAVRQANGGNGLVMQRSYSAPDQATLDAYRDMLYDGKWYVDCSTGGSQYGQGMYAAADYTGKVTADMQKEMRHYTTLNQGRLGAQPLSDEGKEAFLRKWVGENVAETDRDAALTYLKFESHTGNVEWADVGKAVEHLGEEKRLSLLESGIHEDVHQMLDGYSYVETMTLDPSARIVTHDDLRRMKDDYGRDAYAWLDEQKALHQQMYRDGKITPDEGRALDKESTDEFMRMIERSQAVTSMDDGSFAAGLGYDAINATGHGASGSYTVVLNRTKLIIRRPE